MTNTVPENQKKQYLLMVDDVSMALIQNIVPSMSFVPIEGMLMDNQPKYQCLVSPISASAQKQLDGVVESIDSCDGVSDAPYPLMDPPIEDHCVDQ